MNLLHVIEALAKEKGIDPEILIDALERGLVTAAKASRGTEEEERIEARLDRDTGALSVVSVKEVVEEVEDPGKEIALEEARAMYPDVDLGEEIEQPREILELGRIGAQRAKQVITQLVRDAEREIILSTYGDKVFEVISGLVTRSDKYKLFVDIGRTEGHLPYADLIPGDKFKRGDRVRAIIQEVKDTPQGPIVKLSRTSPEFMRKLFEMEVPEIYDGTIQIHTIVRDPGVRAKMSVISNDKNVDPVGACVGVKGSRVQTIVRELRGENIDIIPYTENIVEYVTHALSPARVNKVKVNHDDQSIEVLVDDEFLSQAIGRRGQNVRLAHRLTGWKIDIYSPTKLEELGLDIFNLEVESPFKDGENEIITPSTDEKELEIPNPFKDLAQEDKKPQENKKKEESGEEAAATPAEESED